MSLVVCFFVQLPISKSNKYSFPGDVPVHLCSATSQYGYQMAYGTMVGGALSISSVQYEKVNGYSNFYWGWGQEDDDFYFRISHKFGRVDRLPREQGMYRALSHPRVKDLDVTPVFTKGTEHLRATQAGTFDIMLDGISNLKYQIVETTKVRPGVRRVLVELKFDNMPVDLRGNTK